MSGKPPARGFGDARCAPCPDGASPNSASTPTRRVSRTRPAALALAAASVALATALLSAPAAFAHAELLRTSPQSGATVQRQPAEVIFAFNEAVGATPGAVRVYDARGAEVDELDSAHPGGRQQLIGVHLRPHLPAGTYTATYRVTSADTHVVYGGLVFSIGHPGTPPRLTVAGLIGRERSGHVTAIAFAAIRTLDYLSIALLIGGVAFLIAAWLPGLAAVAGVGPEWQAAARAFAARLWRLLLAAAVLGFAVSVLGIALQGATATGVSLWSSLRGPIVQSTLESRFGEVWGVRAIDWLMLAGLLVLARARARAPASAPSAASAASLQADWWLMGPLLAGAAYLAITPALAGHASVQSPTAVMFVSDVLHVLAASVWVGAIACLLVCVPPATRRLQGRDRSRLLLAVLLRFSPLALAAVIVIAVSGVIQACIDVRSVHALLHSTYGLLILVKVVLLAALIGLGWINRNRVIPALKRLTVSDMSPGDTGVVARRTMRGELALMLCVFVATAALVSYTPPIDVAAGPFSASTTLGPLDLQLTIDPARTGVNRVHIYLIDADDGTQFAGTKELGVTATLPAKHIGPLPLSASVAGPGHYVIGAAPLSPGGDWRLQITDRVSEFEQYSRAVDVPIR